MDTPLYKLYLFKRAPAHYQRPEEEAAARARMAELQAQLGVRDLFHARMAWSNEQFDYFGVEFFPSLAALQGYTRSLGALGFYQFVQGESYLGIPMDPNFPAFEYDNTSGPDEAGPHAPGLPDSSEDEDIPAPVYRLYLSRPAAQAALVPAEERAALLASAQEAMQMLGIETLISAYMRWNHEGWEYFGIERYPGMEAVIAYTQMLEEAGWYRLTESRSYLGSARGGLACGCAED